MSRGNKATAGGLTFVLEGPVGLEVVHGVRDGAGFRATITDLR